MKSLEEVRDDIANNLVNFCNKKKLQKKKLEEENKKLEEELSDKTRDNIIYAITFIDKSGLEKKDKEEALKRFKDIGEDVYKDPEDAAKRLQGAIPLYMHKMDESKEVKKVKREVRDEKFKEKLYK